MGFEDPPNWGRAGFISFPPSFPLPSISSLPPSLHSCIPSCVLTSVLCRIHPSFFPTLPYETECIAEIRMGAGHVLPCGINKHIWTYIAPSLCGGGRTVLKVPFDPHSSSNLGRAATKLGSKGTFPYTPTPLDANSRTFLGGATPLKSTPPQKSPTPVWG